MNRIVLPPVMLCPFLISVKYVQRLRNVKRFYSLNMAKAKKTAKQCNNAEALILQLYYIYGRPT